MIAIKLSIKGQEIELTIEEAKALQAELNSLLKVDKPHNYDHWRINEPNKIKNVPVPLTTDKFTGQKCMFDGLEPGVYGLSCPCPKCSPTLYVI